MTRPAITQPQLVPVTNVDDHLPAVAADALTANAIRERLRAMSAWEPEFAGDGARFSDREPAGAAVLVPLVQREEGLQLLLTRRTDHLDMPSREADLFQVTPVVGLVEPPFEVVLDAFEVAEAFEVPLAFLMDPAHHRHHVFEVTGVQRRFLSMPWRGPEGEYFIWGATAAMLRNLYRLLITA